MEDKMFNLELHEIIETPFGMSIMRVPGGWIYDCWDSDTDRLKQGTFIPLSNEFNPLYK